ELLLGSRVRLRTGSEILSSRLNVYGATNREKLSDLVLQWVSSNGEDLPEERVSEPGAVGGRRALRPPPVDALSPRPGQQTGCCLRPAGQPATGTPASYVAGSWWIPGSHVTKSSMCWSLSMVEVSL